MTAGATLDAIARVRIVPVITIDDAGKAADVASALLAGGIACGEVTLRTPTALQSITGIASVPGFITGVGTVLTADQVDRAADAGATFVITPGYDDEVVERCQELDLLVLPGVATATEMQRALKAGIGVVKFFPADRNGGLPAIKSFGGPFPDLKFIPSGGVSTENAPEYLAWKSIFGISGSWMASREAIAAGDFDGIRELSRQVAALVGA